MSTYKETELPGIGMKFQIDTNSGDKLVIILHEDGKREIHHFDYDDPEDSISMVTLDDTEARRVGAILGGMVYMPTALETVDVEFEDMVIEWFKIPAQAKSINMTLGDLDVRNQTGATIIAFVNKDHVKTINPGSQEVIRKDCTLVIIGERSHVKQCKKLILEGSVK
jgi:TrkA domain protein